MNIYFIYHYITPFILCFFLFLYFIIAIGNNKLLIFLSDFHLKSSFEKDINYKYINITYSTDFKYHLYTIVSITSLMEHSTNKTLWYNIFLLVLPNFDTNALKKFIYLTQKYNRLSVFVINVSNNFKKFKRPGTKILRLNLPNLLPNVTRIIHLDADTLIFKDLDKLYDLNMSNLLIRGVLDYDFFKEMKKFGVENNDHYVNSGVILMNLKEMRKDRFVDIVTKFIDQNGNSLKLNDQPIINILFHQKIGLLPLQFGFHNWYCNEKSYHKFFRAPYFYDYYSMEDVHKIIYNLTIVHFMNKPWNCKSFIKFFMPWKCNFDVPYIQEWGKMALKTQYFKELCCLCPWIRYLNKQ